MRSTTDPAFPREVAAALERVQRWRRTRHRPRRMPEDLWSLAVRLARRHGINPIARGLHLDYSSLKRRLDDPGGASGEGRGASPSFVEMSLSPLLSTAEHVLEFEEPQGAKLVLRLRGPVDVLALAQAFWSRGG